MEGRYEGKISFDAAVVGSVGERTVFYREAKGKRDPVFPAAVRACGHGTVFRLLDRILYRSD